MISFESDYLAGAHPKVLEKLVESNLEVLSGYATDKYCQSAKEKILQSCACPDGEVFFLVGGTQANQLVIDAYLDSYEGVIAAESGHVNTHEGGAIEYTGHKVLALPEHHGKIASTDLAAYLQNFYQDENRDHMVFPGMVYISHPTEFGTLYSKNELTEIYSICQSHQIPLFIDGARLGYGLASLQTDLTLPEIAHLCDCFYIGGTKVGALCGEAVVFPKGNSPKHFITRIKQHGALLAKGRLLGLQFDALFTDNLYLEIGKHAILMAEELKNILREKGYSFYLESPTNQQFIILTNAQYESLKENVAVSFWCALDVEHIVVRFATSWSTTKKELEKLQEIL